jgi:antitoxin StbD
MQTIMADLTVSVTELKRNFASILAQADDSPVAVLNHNRPEAYLISAAHYERLLAYLEDLEDAARVRERSDGPFVEVSLDDL